MITVVEAQLIDIKYTSSACIPITELLISCITRFMSRLHTLTHEYLHLNNYFQLYLSHLLRMSAADFIMVPRYILIYNRVNVI